MYNWDKSLREDRLRRNPKNPSFSSSLLDEIYRRIDGGNEKCEELKLYKDNIAKKHSNGGGGGGGLKAKTNGNRIEDKETGSLRRACLMEKWMEKKDSEKVSARRRKSLPELEGKSQHDNDPLFFSSSSSSSDSSFGGFSSSETESFGSAKSKTSCVTTQRLKPVRTSVSAQPEPAQASQSEFYMFDDYHHWKNHEDLKNDEGLIKLKLRALKIYNNLKKVKQPISPGGRIASFLNSLFTNGSAKKTKNLSSIGGYGDASLERKSKSTQASTCSSASSFSRSCLSKTSQNSREKSNNGVKRKVRFYPVTVIVDEECRPCGHKCIYEEDPKKYARLPQLRSNEEELRLHFMEKNRKMEETARDLLKGYSNQKKSDFMVRNVGDEEYEDDAASDSSSDLFELDHLAFMGNNRNEVGVLVEQDIKIEAFLCPIDIYPKTLTCDHTLAGNCTNNY
ncbi:hypothetical protein F0562_003039 [Nyssa sinensis]|uniref:Protein BIG GRAIN 1-like A n=1 Tax=Nyssa sinensis TaxID=561372 RepID=A0A5J5BX92_9ASTE|nr:hypothetical protein F0562_003039 [Nyssa sinensis]